MKKPLGLYRVLNRDPTILDIQNQGFLNQVPTLGRFFTKLAAWNLWVMPNPTAGRPIVY